MVSNYRIYVKFLITPFKGNQLFIQFFDRKDKDKDNNNKKGDMSKEGYKNKDKRLTVFPVPVGISIIP